MVLFSRISAWMSIAQMGSKQMIHIGYKPSSHGHFSVAPHLLRRIRSAPFYSIVTLSEGGPL